MYRYFKCNRLGGFRLSDLNRKIYTDEYLYVDKHVCDTSRSVNAALKAKWMLEVTQEEASKYISIPDVQISQVKKEVIEITKKNIGKSEIDAKEINKSLESRQTARTFRKTPMQKQKQEEKPVVPNFNKAERRMRERQADITTKGPDELLKSPVKKKELSVAVTPSKSDVVKNLSKEIGADNTLLATPNFDEGKQEIKKEIVQEIEKRVIIKRRKKAKPTTQE